MGFLDKLKDSFQGAIEALNLEDNQLAVVVKENKQMLDAHGRLTKESQEGFEQFRSYAESESPGIQQALNSIADALQTIETNRIAFIEQLRFDFINPLEGLIDLWKKLQVEIREDEKAAGQKEKMGKNLAKKKAKPAAKLKPGEIESAENAFKEASASAEKEHQDVIDATANFKKEKIKTIKDALNILVERNLNFHNQALNIIDNAETLIKKIDVEAELETE